MFPRNSTYYKHFLQLHDMCELRIKQLKCFTYTMYVFHFDTVTWSHKIIAFT